MATLESLINELENSQVTPSQLVKILKLIGLKHYEFDLETPVNTFSSSTFTDIGSLEHSFTLNIGDVVISLLSGSYSTNSASTYGNVRITENGSALHTKRKRDDSASTTGEHKDFTIIVGSEITEPGGYTYVAQANREAGSNVFYTNDVSFLTFALRKLS